MTYYFSIFLPVREGGYAIFFPDFPEIASEGETVDECMVMAQDALIHHRRGIREGPPRASRAFDAGAGTGRGAEGA